MRRESEIKKNLEVPFRDGKFMDWDCSGTKKRLNEPFLAQLKYTSTSRGRSSVKFNFQDDSGCSFGMFLTDFDKLIKDRPVNKPIMARWAFVKRGYSYGIVLIKEENNE